MVESNYASRLCERKDFILFNLYSKFMDCETNFNDIIKIFTTFKRNLNLL